MKKIYYKMLMVAVVICLTTSFANASYFETFNSDSAGFHYGYGSSFNDGPVTWSSSGGDPDGNISGAADDLYAVWVYSTDISGNFGNMTGLTMTIETKIEGAVSGNAQFYVGRTGTYYIGAYTWDLSADSEWTTHSIVLNDSNLNFWTGKNVSATLAYVLEDADDIGIFFGGATASGGGKLKVDNFGAVPIPGAVWLLGSGLIGLVGIRRKFKKAIS